MHKLFKDDTVLICSDLEEDEKTNKKKYPGLKCCGAAWQKIQRYVWQTGAKRKYSGFAAERWYIASRDHPFVTEANGVVRAGELTGSDRLLTEFDGYTEIKAIYEISYDGTVYSLYTEPSGNVICEGLITGDFSVQNQTKSLKERKKTFTADKSEKVGGKYPSSEGIQEHSDG